VSEISSRIDHSDWKRTPELIDQH